MQHHTRISKSKRGEAVGWVGEHLGELILMGVLIIIMIIIWYIVVHAAPEAPTRFFP